MEKGTQPRKSNLVPALKFGMAIKHMAAIGALLVSKGALANIPAPRERIPVVVQLESPGSDEQLAEMYKLARRIVKRPLAMAEEMADDFNGLPRGRWRERWSTELKTLDLLAYLFEIESTLRYAASNRWQPPEHFLRTKHLWFYLSLNTKASPHGRPVISPKLGEFAVAFLSQIKTAKKGKVREFLLDLTAKKRQFWTEEIAAVVIPDRAFHSSTVALLIPRLWDDAWDSVISAAFRRGDGEAVLRAALAEKAESGTLKRWQLTPAYLSKDVAYCEKSLERLEAEFMGRENHDQRDMEVE